MTVRQAADLLGCSDMTIYRRIAARRFPAVCLGRKAMVPRSFVQGLLDRAEAGVTVVVDEAVDEWTTHVEALPTNGDGDLVATSGIRPDMPPAPRTQMSPGGIAARRGSASDAPAEEMSTPFHGIGGWTR